MFTLFKYLVWLVVSLMFLMLATISISEFLVESAVDAPFDEKLTDYVRMLASDVRADASGVRLRPGAVGLLRSDRQDRIFYALRDDRGDLIDGESQLPSPVGPLRPGVPSLQNGQVGEEPVRIAAMQVADPRNSAASLTLQVAETMNKRQALTETMRTQAVALPQMLVLVVAVLLIVYGYTYVLRPMQRLRALIDNRGLND